MIVAIVCHIFRPKAPLAAAWRAAFIARDECPPFPFSLVHLLRYFPTAGCITAEGLTRERTQTFLFQIAAFRQDLENSIKPYDCKRKKSSPSNYWASCHYL